MENTYDLLVGSLSIGIPSIKLMNSEKYNFIHHFYLWAHKWLKWLAWSQKCIEYVPYAVNLLKLIEMRNTQHITDSYSKFFFSCSSARPHLFWKKSASSSVEKFISAIHSFGCSVSHPGCYLAVTCHAFIFKEGFHMRGRMLVCKAESNRKSAVPSYNTPLCTWLEKCGLKTISHEVTCTAQAMRISAWYACFLRGNPPFCTQITWEIHEQNTQKNALGYTSKFSETACKIFQVDCVYLTTFQLWHLWLKSVRQ